MRMREAVITALRDSMREDERVVLLGEDVALAGGVFKTSEGLLAEFGPSRVRDTPISEMGFLGAAVGAAMTGLRPVVEIMFVEFLGVAFDQLVTQAAKLHYLSGGTLTVPLVVRASGGAGMGFGAQHSQMLETWMFATPGIKVAVASGARSAYGLITAAIQDDGPVVILEPRSLYATSENVETSENDFQLGKAYLLSEGKDVTVVGLGATTQTIQQWGRSSEWSADVIDLSSLIPWDKSAVVNSVGKTGRLVIVEEGPFTGGWGTELASYISSVAFHDLKSPILRITAPDVPVPYGKHLESRYIPSVEYVESQISHLISNNELPSAWWSSEVSG